MRPMSHVIVLTCNPARPCIEAGLTRLGTRPLRWLLPGVAAELPDRDLQVTRAALNGLKIDVNRVAQANRRKRLLLADMESTLIENEMLDDLADRLGIGPRVHEITRRAMNGELDFRAALEERVALLAGQPATMLDEAARSIRIMAGARTLIRTMRAHGAYTAIVSGGFRCFTSLVRDQLGCDDDQANVLEIVDGVLTGRVLEPLVTKQTKLDALHQLAASRGLTVADTIAVGDGANDLPMLHGAGMGVAFHAKPAVAAAVDIRIDHGDLAALLYLQGYEATEIT